MSFLFRGRGAEVEAEVSGFREILSTGVLRGVATQPTRSCIHRALC